MMNQDIKLRKWLDGKFLNISSMIFFLITNFIIFILFIVLFYQSWIHYNNQAKIWTQNIAKLLEISVIDKFDDINVCLSAIKHESERQLRDGNINVNEIESYIKYQESQLEGVTTLVIADENGDVKYGLATGQSEKINVADRDYFIRLRDNPDLAFSNSGLLKGRAYGTWDVILARKIQHPTGRFAGVVIAGFDVRYFNNLFSKLDVGKHGAIGIRDTEFHLMALYPTGKEPGSQIGSNLVSQTTRDMTKTNSMTATYRTVLARDNRERVVTFRRISKYPLLVFATSAPRDFLSAWWKELYFASVLLVILMTATGIAAHISRKNHSIEIERAAAIRYGKEMQNQYNALSEAMSRIKSLEGIISICAYCKKIRNEKQSWDQLEKYITEHSDAHFSHGICPECTHKYFPNDTDK